jgi:hypothetical protein
MALMIATPQLEQEEIFRRGVACNLSAASVSTPAVRMAASTVSKPATPALDSVRSERRRALIIPREHGAWGLLFVPMVTGAGVAFRESSNIFPFVLLLTAALVLFWLRTPMESLLGTSAMRAQTADERREVMFVASYLGAVAALALTMLLWIGHHPFLWYIGAVAGLAFIAQAVFKKLGRRTRMLSEMLGTIGLTASAPAAYYVIAGKFGATAWMLWLANLLFAGDQIHYVQLKIHTARVEGFRNRLVRGWAFAVGQALMTAIITLACVSRLMPKYASLAFAPLLFRGWLYFIQQAKPLIVRRLGWNELAHAITFCVLLISAYLVA